MKLGVQIVIYEWEGGPPRLGETLAALARTADDAGFDLIGVADHLWQGAYTGGVLAPSLECFTTLATVAAHTRRCRLLPLVVGVHFRQPALLAKMVTTLDVLSGGRAMLGIGAGYYEEEARGMGIPFPPQAERFEMLEETLQICQRLWQGDHGDERPFAGAHFQLERPLNVPQSLTRPHPPILIGGSGERKTMPLVARYANACNLYPTPDLPQKLDALRRRCDEERRDFSEIEKTCTIHFDVGERGEKAGEQMAELRRLAGLGIQTAIGIVHGPEPIRVLELVGTRIIAEASGF
jgi:F420-dependent oxidoreductase-like protein